MMASCVENEDCRSNESIGYADQIKQMGYPEDLLKYKENENKVIEIGKEIYAKYGHEGMVFVCEFHRAYCRHLEHI